MLRHAAQFAGLITTVVGIAGLPETIRELPVLRAATDDWNVRTLLVLLGIAVLTHPQWLPHLERWLGVNDQGWAFWYGWNKARLHIWLEKRGWKS